MGVGERECWVWNAVGFLSLDGHQEKKEHTAEPARGVDERPPGRERPHKARHDARAKDKAGQLAVILGEEGDEATSHCLRCVGSPDGGSWMLGGDGQARRDEKTRCERADSAVMMARH